MAKTKSSCLSPFHSCRPNSIQTFVDNSPVQPSRPPSNYRIDSRTSIQISEPSSIHLSKVVSTSVKEFPAQGLRHKKACEALHEAATSTSKPAGHQRTSSLEKAMKKLHELFKGREDSSASFASVLQKAEDVSGSPIAAPGDSSEASSVRTVLRHQPDMLNLRFEFEKNEGSFEALPSVRPLPHIPSLSFLSVQSGDGESAWVTEYGESESGHHSFVSRQVTAARI
ncbi:hypothetical protein KC340_g2644 [Hortaea werneckii]|nr:hypothetical protein KC342_g1868 [Hortaea werneckii]KAI7105651.1 hypothetical protein KC339_g3690 [Hortaea werneckii]KAI7238538.1 hypothetical protein KC365_g4400 [Hortaea werneckii]KAI7333973.1 hypothetical protein KC340_g2644 [Hortaea werneckii]KAI7388672.1 hypothetical protein KC328_g8824 [Hortaea werneckii]